MGSIIKVDHLSYVYNPGMPNAVTALDDDFDTEAFAKKVVEILKQPEQRKQMGKCAIERSQDFSLEKVLPLFKQYLEEAAKGV